MTAKWAEREERPDTALEFTPGSDAFVGGDFEPISGAPRCQLRMRIGVPPGCPVNYPSLLITSR